MSLELVINTSSGVIEIALLRDKRLRELHQEKGNNDFAVGDVYLGKVRKIVPSLNAAFVDVGYEKDAFLHYLDLGPQFASLTKYGKGASLNKLPSAMLNGFTLEQDINKAGKINEVISNSQQIIVQIAKEPISSKGPRLSSELTLAGRYIVLVPFSNKVSISQKIKDQKERDRLKNLLMSIKPKNFGVIIRTVAENKKVAELDQDLKGLITKWKEIYKNIKNKPKVPKRVLGELDRTSSLLRDLLNSKFTNIHVDTPQILGEVESYIKKIAPGKENILKLHQGKDDIFEKFGIHKQIKASFGKQVSMPSGGYLIVEHTEAMHVIDVNSGNRKNPEKSQEENALVVNIEAAQEIARVLQLRDMGGIIAIDFIDMTDRENNKALFDKLKEFMREDRAKHSILPPSKFGVIEITRQRVRPVTDIKTTEACPVCSGTGESEATILIIDEIENQLSHIVKLKRSGSILLKTHPFIASHLTKGMFSLRFKWFLKHNKWIKIVPISSFHFLEYRFLNSKNEAIIG